MLSLNVVCLLHYQLFHTAPTRLCNCKSVTRISLGCGSNNCRMQALCSGCVKRLRPVLVRFYQWSGETHYSVLGVLPDASPREIKIAYLALSKKLHPDLNQGKDDKTTFEIHQSYVRVNQAYAVLGNKNDRAVYDIQLQGRTPSEEEENGRMRSRGERMHTTPTRAEFMSFEERAKSMGYNQVKQLKKVV